MIRVSGSSSTRMGSTTAQFSAPSALAWSRNPMVTARIPPNHTGLCSRLWMSFQLRFSRCGISRLALRCRTDEAALAHAATPQEVAEHGSLPRPGAPIDDYGRSQATDLQVSGTRNGRGDTLTGRAGEHICGFGRPPRGRPPAPRKLAPDHDISPARRVSPWNSSARPERPPDFDADPRHDDVRR